MKNSNFDFLFSNSEIPDNSEDYILILEMRDYFHHPQKNFRPKSYEFYQKHWEKLRNVLRGKLNDSQIGSLPKRQYQHLFQKFLELANVSFKNFTKEIDIYTPIERAFIIQNIRRGFSFERGLDYIKHLESTTDSSTLEALGYVPFFHPIIESGAILFGNFTSSHTRNLVWHEVIKVEESIIQGEDAGLSTILKNLTEKYVIPNKLVSIFFDEGMYYYRKEDFQKAFESFDRANFQGYRNGYSGIRPFYVQFYLALTHLFLSDEAKEDKKFQEAINKAISMGMPKTEVFRKIAIAYLNRGKSLESRSLLLKSKEKFEQAIYLGDRSHQMVVPIHHLNTLLNHKLRRSTNIELPVRLLPNYKHITLDIDKAEKEWETGSKEEAANILARVEFALSLLPTHESTPVYYKLGLSYEYTLKAQKEANRIYSIIINQNRSNSIAIPNKSNATINPYDYPYINLDLISAFEKIIFSLVNKSTIDRSDIGKIIYLTEKAGGQVFFENFIKQQSSQISLGKDKERMLLAWKIFLEQAYDQHISYSFDHLTENQSLILCSAFRKSYFIILLANEDMKLLHKVTEKKKLWQFYNDVNKYFRRTTSHIDIGQDYEQTSMKIMPESVWKTIDKERLRGQKVIVSIQGILKFVQIGWLINKHESSRIFEMTHFLLKKEQRFLSFSSYTKTERTLCSINCIKQA